MSTPPPYEPAEHEPAEREPPEDERPEPASAEPSEEELRAAFEEQLRKISATDVIVQTAVSLINIAGRRLGTAPGTEDERDLAQVRDAIDGVRGLLPVLERGEMGPTLSSSRPPPRAAPRPPRAAPNPRGTAASSRHLAARPGPLSPAGGSGFLVHKARASRPRRCLCL